MHNKKGSWGAVCLLAILSLVMYGCGGGGGSSSVPDVPDMPDTMPDPDMPDPDPDPDPVEPDPDPDPDPMPDPEPDQAAIDAEAMRVAGALGDNTNVTASLPANATRMMGKIVDDMTPTGFKADMDTQYTAIPGWTSNAYTQTNQAGNVMVEGVLYNNIDPPTAQRYAVYFGNGGDGLDLSFVDSATVGDTDDGKVTFAATADISDHSDRFMASGFPSGGITGNEISDYPGVDDTETPAVDNEVEGSFFGIPGTFECGGGDNAGCTARTKDGMLSGLTGAWTFTPTRFTAGSAADANAGTPATGTMVPGVVADADYMVFGYWLEKTTARDGEVTYTVNVYRDGIPVRTDLANVEGTATYEGPATGLYMKKTVDPSGEPTSPFISGQFTADAMLTASFGGDTVGSAHTNTVTGKISNFMNASGNSIAPWMLMLNRTPASGDGAITAGVFSGTTSGYEDGAQGAWNGTLYGTADADADAMQYPSSIAGTFNGHFKNGHVGGVFGTTLVDE